MKEGDTKISRLRKLARQTVVLQARDLTPLGIPKRYLARICAEGVFVKTGHGLYMTSGGPETLHLGLALVAKAISRSVVCLLSALRFHEIGTQAPHQVWIALNRRSSRPRMTQNQPINIVASIRQKLLNLVDKTGEDPVCGLCLSKPPRNSAL